MEWWKGIDKVSILDKDGNKLCSIRCPLKWGFIRQEWKNPESIVRWAWYQTFETHTFYLSHNINTFNSDSPATPCVKCKTQSVKPVWVTGLFRSGVTGIQCENRECVMYRITIPWRMLKNIKQVPEKYIPNGFFVKR